VQVQEALKRAVVSHRFPIQQGHKLKDDLWKKVVRLIDDFSVSFVNDACSPGEKISYHTLDTLIGLIQCLSASGHRVSLRKDDFKAAYKTLPILTEHLDLAVVLYRTISGDVNALQL